MKFGMVANTKSQKCLDISSDILEYLKSKSFEVSVEKELADELNMHGVELNKIDVEVIIVVGGDGTVLNTIQHAKGKVLGINVGQLGFLTTVEPENWKEYIDRLLRRNYFVDIRKKIKVEVNGERLFDSMNEVVIHTSKIAKLRQFRIYDIKSEELIDDLRADGIIIATPTGSTSYVLSTGGPIAHPKLDAMVITYIAPFKFTKRSYVIPSDSILKINIVDRECILAMDGQEYITVGSNDEIRLTESENKAEFISFTNEFYRHVREKLR